MSNPFASDMESSSRDDVQDVRQPSAPMQPTETRSTVADASTIRLEQDSRYHSELNPPEDEDDIFLEEDLSSLDLQKLLVSGKVSKKEKENERKRQRELILTLEETQLFG